MSSLEAQRGLRGHQADPGNGVSGSVTKSGLLDQGSNEPWADAAVSRIPSHQGGGIPSPTNGGQYLLTM
eukprot:12427483-Karenia_brevis.AAC.1